MTFWLKVPLFMWCLYNDHTAFSHVVLINESKKKKKEKKLKEQKILLCVRAGGDYHGKKKNLSNLIEKSCHKH